MLPWDGLTESDIAAMVADISTPGTAGRSSSGLAFRLLLTIAGEPRPDGELILTRARLRAFYEGDLLPALITQRATNPEPIASTCAAILVGAMRAIREHLVRYLQSSFVISTIVRRNPSRENISCAPAFGVADMSKTRGAPRLRIHSIAAFINSVATPLRRALSRTTMSSM